VPALPVLGHGIGLKRAVEIAGQAKTEDGGAADGDVRVAGKVAKDLERKRQGGEQGGRAGMAV
jgi:hypothetical protein